jgi:hypothetical protein
MSITTYNYITVVRHFLDPPVPSRARDFGRNERQRKASRAI